MEDFLHKLQISESAIKIYLNCIQEVALTQDEIRLFLPELEEQDFINALSELVNIKLLIPIIPKNTKLLTHYSPIPPLRAISDYYKNIKDNIEKIKEQLSKILEKALDSVFENTELIELNTIYNASRELKKDIEEETIIQKQDAEDIVEGMENLRILSNVLNELQNKIKGITQSEFASLIKILPKIEKELKEQIESKKYKRELIEIIEKVFKKNFEEMVNEFTANLHELIQEDFEHTLESINNIINSTYQFRDDFKMLLLNMLNNFELKINSVLDLIKEKHNKLEEQKDQFNKVIFNEVMKINENSINSIVSLNEPINSVIQNYLQTISASTKNYISDMYQVRSLIKVRSEINSFIKNAQGELTMILPVIEGFLKSDQILDLKCKVRLASSEAHTNSTVKKFKEKSNLEYRSLKNTSVIILKADRNHLLMGTIQIESEDELKDFIGFTTDYNHFIKLLEPSIRSIWEIGSSDTFQTPKSVGIEGNLELITEHLKKKEPKLTEEALSDLNQSKIKISTNKTKKKDFKAEEKQAPPLEIPKTEINPSKIQPQSGDKNGMIINDAFNSLIDKLSSMKGIEFGEELQKIAELVLEKKGFSVTLHKIRSLINQFKLKDDILNELDKKQIVASINDWKTHLF